MENFLIRLWHKLCTSDGLRLERSKCFTSSLLLPCQLSSTCQGTESIRDGVKLSSSVRCIIHLRQPLQPSLEMHSILLQYCWWLKKWVLGYVIPQPLHLAIVHSTQILDQSFSLTLPSSSSHFLPPIIRMFLVWWKDLPTFLKTTVLQRN